ncbi:MAG: hypothetical protein WCJ81_07425 [bacterium]
MFGATPDGCVVTGTVGVITVVATLPVQAGVVVVAAVPLISAIFSHACEKVTRNTHHFNDTFQLERFSC